MIQKEHILVVDDDNRLRSLLKKYILDNGFDVSVAKDAAEARKKLEQENISLIVLDIMMPNETGIEFAGKLKENKNTIPILMLTAMGEPEDRISGLETGIDDYLVKPFEPRELVLRINAILKRYRKPEKDYLSKIAFGDFIFDLETLTLKQQGETIHLTSGETELLKILVRNEGKPVKREEFAEYTGLNVNDRSIDVQILRLRKKIEKDPRQPQFIRTIRHKGYVLQAE